MPVTLAPNTRAIGDQIVSFLASLTYPGGALVYQVAQLEQIFDVLNQVTGGGVVVEVYGNLDSSERRGFGGRVWDTQDWYILSMCSVETGELAAQIYDVRDALVQPFQTHATLGTQVFNLFRAELKENSGRFGKVVRNGQEVKMHLITLTTMQEWQVPPPGVIA
jgi:hypothetical protein